MDQIIKEKEKLKEKIENEGLVPAPRNAGEFIKPKRDPANDKIKFLSPNNWVFHDSIVENVLKGDYQSIIPYSGEFVTTMNCSNRCRIPCGYQTQKQIEGVWDKNDFLNPRVHMQNVGFAKDLLTRLYDGGIKGLIFTGGGEPSMFRGLEELVAYCTEKGIDCVVYTNGNSLSERRIDNLMQASPLLIRVSLNAGTEEVYNEFNNPIVNRKDAFKNTLKTIEYLAKGSLQNPKISVGVSVVINEINRYDLVETAKRIREIVDKTGGGISFMAYRPAFNYYSSKQLGKELLEETYEIVETQVRAILNGTNVLVSNVTARYEALKYDTRTYDACRANGLFAEVAPSGKMHFCCERNMDRDYVIGDLTENRIEEIWDSEQRKDLIDYIDSCKCSVCPPACKPHETNRQFEQIETLRKAGELYKIELWIEEQRKMPKPKMVNF